MSTNNGEYEWLSGKDHVKKRVGMYVGSHNITTITGIGFNYDESNKLTASDYECITSPVIFKLFDEAVSNALDNSRKHESQKYIKASVNKDTGVFSVTNDAANIPIDLWEGSNRYVPEILFSELNSGSNFSDDRGSTIGMNGLGITVTNILSEWFEINIVNLDCNKKYKQMFKNNASVIGIPKISEIAKADKRSCVTISWKPDFARFGIVLPLDTNTVKLLETRMYDIAACSRSNLSIYFNDSKISVKSMKDYHLALGGTFIGRDEVQKNNQNVFEFSISYADKNKGQESKVVGFVNGIQCSQGTHIDMVYRRIIECLNELCKKKKKTGTIRPQLVKDSLILLVNINVPNPSFTSQSKEKLDTTVDKYGFKYVMCQNLIKQLEKSSLMDDIITSIQNQEDKDVAKSVQQSKRQKNTIPKYQRALKTHANLYVTEGDSAMAMALSGFSVIGRDKNGVFPLRGKLLNTMGLKAKKALENKEIMYLTQILGLEPYKLYDESNTKNLPYRHVIIFTDQDTDGSHIMGLLIVFLREFFPSILQFWPDFIQRFATHIVKAKIGNEQKSFFSLQEYNSWLADRLPSHVKYYKGLGTSTDEEAIEYFKNIKDHLIEVEYTGINSEDAIKSFFSSEKTGKRKEMLKSIDESSFIDYKKPKTTIEEWCNKEYIHHCAADNGRSIGSAIDGLKPSQRKIIHTARNRKKGEVKVAALGASTTEITCYHHGETSLITAIMLMAQQHIGTNNIAFLKPIGQFGSRLTRREKGLAAPRYVFTEIADISNMIFRSEDDPILDYLEDDGNKIEPKYFVPIIASSLINGCEGIGTGYRTLVPNFNPIDIISRTRDFINGKEIDDIIPYYYGFKGKVSYDDNTVTFTGNYDIQGNKIIITELPPKVWSYVYFEWIQTNGPDYIVDAITRCNKEEVYIEITCKSGMDMLSINVIDDLKLSSKESLSEMILFDENHNLVKYNKTSDIIKNHAKVRIETYKKRLLFEIDKASKESELYENKARFLKEVVDGKLVLTNKKKDELRKSLKESKYLEYNNFDYLIDMKIFTLTVDEVSKMIALADKMKKEVEILKNTTPFQIWLKELGELETEYKVYLENLKNSDKKHSKKRKL